MGLRSQMLRSYHLFCMAIYREKNYKVRSSVGVPGAYIRILMGSAPWFRYKIDDNISTSNNLNP